MRTCSLELSSDPVGEVRSRAVALLGLHSSVPVRQALVKALGDPDPFVRRHACEALMQQPSGEIPVEALVPLLSDSDRWIRFAARVAIEHGEPGRPPRSATGDHRSAGAHRGNAGPGPRDPSGRGGAGSSSWSGSGPLWRSTSSPTWNCDLLRLIELTFLLGPQKAEAPAASRH